MIFGLLLVVFGAGMLLFFGPKQRVDFEKVAMDDMPSAGELDAYLTESEAQFSDIKSGQEKQIIWAGAKGQQTDLAIVYIHGYSASLGEIRPVPDELAKELGANLYYTRLAGHGRPGEAMAEPHVMDWVDDLYEAMHVGSEIGKRVIVMGTSTGATLASLIVEREELSQNVAGMIMISPNFAVTNKSAGLAKLAFFDKWGPMLAGEWREWEPASELHAQYWTTGYPTKSVVPMMRLIDHVEKIDFAQAKMPALFYYALDDQVCDQSITAERVANWGGGATILHPNLTDADDAYRHVIAGDALSPDQNAPAKAAMLSFIRDNL